MTPRDMPARPAVLHICPQAPNKRRFDTYADAVHAYRTQRGGHVTRHYVYACPACGYYHLTSQRQDNR